MNPRQRTGVLLMIGAALLAIVLFFVISNYVSGVNSRVAPLVTAYSVTDEGIDAYAVIDAEDVEEVEIPRRYLPDSAITDLQDIVGQRAAFNIAAGTYIGADMLRPNSSLGDNEREVALTVDATTGIAGRIAPGDFVDVIAVLQPDEGPASSQAVARSVRVVSVGGAEVRTEQTGRTELEERSVIPVTLALTPEETYAVTLADSTAVSVRLIGLPDGLESDNRGNEPVGTNTSLLQSQIG